MNDLLAIQASPEVIEIIQLVGTFLLGWLTRVLTPQKKKEV